MGTMSGSGLKKSGAGAGCCMTWYPRWRARNSCRNPRAVQKHPSWRMEVLVRRWIPMLLPLLLVACTRAEKLDVSRLRVPAGFQVDVFAQAPNARMLVFSPGGVLVVTDTEDGKVLAFPDRGNRGKPERTVTVL